MQKGRLFVGLVLGCLFVGLLIIALVVACFVYRWHIKLSRKYKTLQRWRVFAPIEATEDRDTRITWNQDVEVFPRSGLVECAYFA